MSGARKNTRTHVEIDGQRFLLDTDRDLVEVMERIEAAARSEPAFVHLSGGDHLISVLVSPGSKAVVTVERDSVTQPEEHAPVDQIPEWDY
ncbi:hypothetical protein [Microbacterium oxydans]|jgi:hypothetical protein|uniref:hypothetical protein n=1 Tax=Microbacterium oxydans TaxID=82380 RepID=UPI0037C77573